VAVEGVDAGVVGLMGVVADGVANDADGAGEPAEGHERWVVGKGADGFVAREEGLLVRG